MKSLFETFLKRNKESAPKGLLERLSKNLSGNKLSLRLVGISGTIVPDELLSAKPKAPIDEEYLAKIKKARPLTLENFSLNLRDSGAGVREQGGSLIYEPAITMRANNMDLPAITLADIDGTSDMAWAFNKGILNVEGDGYKGEVLKKNMDYVEMVEKRINNGISEGELKEFALTKLKEYYVAQEGHKKGHEEAYANTETPLQDRAYSEEQIEIYTEKLSRIQALIAALEEGTATARFSIAAGDYGTTSLRLKIQLLQKSKWAKE